MSPLLDLGCVGCLSFVLECLDLKDLCRLGGSCQALHSAALKELEKRGQHWTASTSLGWEILPSSDADDEFFRHGKSADEVPFDEARESLDPDFQGFAPSKETLFQNIAAWCGGWARLLYARQTGAPRQISVVDGFAHFDGDTGTIRFSTPGEHDGSGQVLLWDIHCGGEWKWSCIMPVHEREYNTVVFDVNGEGRGGAYFFPTSTKCLGDATDAATIHSMCHRSRSNHYTASTDVSDQREWQFNISVVSPRCSETLIVSRIIVPAVIASNYLQADVGSVGNSGLGIPPNEELIQRAGLTEEEVLFLDENLLSRAAGHVEEFAVAGVDENGGLVAYGGITDMAVYVDKRGPANQIERFHLTFDLCCESTLLNKMIAGRPPTQR